MVDDDGRKLRYTTKQRYFKSKLAWYREVLTQAKWKAGIENWGGKSSPNITPRPTIRKILWHVLLPKETLTKRRATSIEMQSGAIGSSGSTATERAARKGFFREWKKSMGRLQNLLRGLVKMKGVFLLSTSFAAEPGIRPLVSYLYLRSHARVAGFRGPELVHFHHFEPLGDQFSHSHCQRREAPRGSWTETCSEHPFGRNKTLVFVEKKKKGQSE